MVSAASFATLFYHPASPIAGLITSPALARVPMGVAMGSTAVAIIYSRLGQRSGAHMNPAVTLAFLRLGRVAPAHAVQYVIAQFAGGLIGITAATLALGGLPADPPIHYVATRPGQAGPLVALLAETTISFVMMATVLVVSRRQATAPWTGVAAGTLVALFVIVEDPLSGMSMNPARSLGPALLSGSTGSLWIYFAGPILGMALAAELFARVFVRRPRDCARLYHGPGPCIFGCGDAAASGPKEAAAA